MEAGRRFAWYLALLGSLLSAGCRNRDLVENELRARDIQYREALEELAKSEARIEALQRELDALRRGSKLPPEQAAQSYGLKRITLGRLTGGYDNDGLPGDEALQVVIEPRDWADHTVKAVGRAEIAVLEISPQGVKNLIGEYHIGQEQLRAAWKYGLLGTGYSLIVPWKAAPLWENVRVVVRFVTPDGRTFEADRDVKVRLLPGRSQRPSAPDSPASDPVSTPKALELNVPTSHWVPAPLEGSVQLGRPIPYHVDGPSLLNRLHDQGLRVVPAGSLK